MMKNVKKMFALFLLVPLGSVAAEISPEYLAEIEKMRTYFDKEELSVQLAYKVYTQGDGKLLDSKLALFEKSGTRYYYSLDGVTIIQNDEWQLYVNTDEKLLAVKEHDSETFNSLMSFDEATKGCETIFRFEEGNNYVYTLTFKKPVSSVYSQVKIYALKSNFTPLKLVFDYAQTTTQTDASGTVIKDKLRMEISYLHLGEKVGKSFSTADYFKKENDVLKPIGKYSDYQLFDQRTHTIK